jgi:hypothetical protein
MGALLKSIDYMAVWPTDGSYISPEEYLTIERASEEKHEYYEGEIVTMNGASMSHILIDAARHLIDIFRKLGDSPWEKESVIDPAGFLHISTIKFRLPLEEIYRNVVFSRP